ncbi:MAG: TetR/AcrR family transcriptional regulator [Treponema sp.]|nr:TetR/AcrR family transcriptional regulator [Treponema sp.]
MAKKKLDKDKIINAFLNCAFEKSAGAVSLADIANLLDANKASLYNHFSSREEIYEETLDLCARYMHSVSFVTDKTVFSEEPFALAAEKIIMQYFRSYELEPLFQMYSLVHSCQFFSSKAALAVQEELKKIEEGVKLLILAYQKSIENTNSNKNIAQEKKASNQLENNMQKNNSHENIAKFFAFAIFAKLNLFVANKKEYIRKNPESGAGTLFSDSSEEDELQLAHIAKNFASHLENLCKSLC